MDDSAFFLSRYYSSEVGTDSRKITVIGSTGCCARSLHRPLLPSEGRYLLEN